MNETDLKLMKKVISRLLKMIDFMGDQLDHALKNIDDKEFKKRADKYFKKFTLLRQHKDYIERKKEIERLKELFENMDDHVLSDIFECDLSDFKFIK
jgi:protein subunit release factor A